ncbi:MAG: hypothetical protein H6727_03650 [Myxococcales bacterium]|nr:hypothetical protein [Myxococcales bacterium]
MPIAPIIPPSPLSGLLLFFAFLLSPPTPPKDIKPIQAQRLYRYTVPKAQVLVTLNLQATAQQLKHGLFAMQTNSMLQKSAILREGFTGAQSLLDKLERYVQSADGRNLLEDLKAATISFYIPPSTLQTTNHRAFATSKPTSQHTIPERVRFLLSVEGVLSQKNFADLIKKSSGIHTVTKMDGWTLVVTQNVGKKKVDASGKITTQKPNLDKEAAALSPQGHLISGDVESVKQAILSSVPRCSKGFDLRCLMLKKQTSAQQVAVGVDMRLLQKQKGSSFEMLRYVLPPPTAMYGAVEHGHLQFSLWAEKTEHLTSHGDLLRSFGHFMMAGDHASRGLLFLLKALGSQFPMPIPPEAQKILNEKETLLAYVTTQLRQQVMSMKVTQQAQEKSTQLLIKGPPTPLVFGVTLVGLGAVTYFMARSIFPSKRKHRKVRR